MKAVPLKCPTCSASVELHPEQRFYKCQYCGTSFVVELSEVQKTAKLVAFEKILEKVMDNTEFLAAERQLQYIDGYITEAHDEVKVNKSRVAEMSAMEKTVREQTQQELITLQKYVSRAVLGAILIWILLIILQASAWYLAILISMGLGIIAWKLDEKRKALESEAPVKYNVARGMVERVQDSLNASLIKLQDRYMEKDLCQRKLRNYRFTGRS